MAADADWFPEDLSGLSKYSGLFNLVSAGGTNWICQWTKNGSVRGPIYTTGGVTGFVVRDGGAIVKVHVCRKNPCTHNWSGNKYAAGRVPPVHMRLARATVVPPPADASGVPPPPVACTAFE